VLLPLDFLQDCYLLTRCSAKINSGRAVDICVLYQHRAAAVIMKGNANGPKRLEIFLKEREPNEYEELGQFYEGFHLTAESVKILADACRDPGWRSPLAHAGFLSLIRNLSSTVLDHRVSLQILRFIANCCANNNESRDLVLNDLDKLSACLQDDHLFDFAVVALNNVCSEYGKTKLCKPFSTCVLILGLRSSSGCCFEARCSWYTWCRASWQRIEP